MSDLRELAGLAGIQTSYQDVWGNTHRVPESTISALLAALQFEHDTSSCEIKIIPEQKKTSIVVSETIAELINEQGIATPLEIVKGRAQIPALSPGYYQLRTNAKLILLLATPSTCWMPEDMQEEAMHQRKRLWGVAAQLYSIRSKHNWGIGDFTDLVEFGKKAAKQGADIIGLNPLHAMFPNNPHAFSPYAPSNRLFLNVIYIDPARIEGFKATKELQQKITMACERELVDYPTILRLKLEVLEKLYKAGSNIGKFQEYCSEQGAILEKQALFDALSEHFTKQNIFSWQEWPEPYRTPASEEVKAFADEHKERIEFYQWLQFIADSQLAHAEQTALKHGMKIGLYRDLAVGPESAGAEIWLNADAYLKDVSIGAPPDEYNPKGQNWGLPPLHPHRLRENQFAPFIALLRANMRHARALRIDHAFGLSRLFLIPKGKTAEEGAYVHYPFEEMLAVLRIESHHNKCMVIGEDLGTFPPNYKELAAASGVLSYKVLYFEKNERGFIPPDHYPPLSLATISTHDLPTLAGWQESVDIDEKAALNLYPSTELLEKDRANRTKDIVLLKEAMDGEITNENAAGFLAKTPAAIVMFQLEDILHIKRQMNMPATINERPNWQMRLPQALEDINLSPVALQVNKWRAAPLLEPPRATYRLQFHKDFTFHDAAKIIPYLAALGISHIYASPYLTARPGSTHGYDITNHNELNPELGGEEGYKVFTSALKDYGLKQILDFVPNHMGIGADNSWWQDVLQKGQASPYAKYFDIDWTPRYGATTPKLLLPVLGKHYGDALASSEIALISKESKYVISYFDHKFPIRLDCYDDIAATGLDTLNKNKEAFHALLEKQHYRLAFWRVASSEINYRRFFDIQDLAGLRVEEPELFDDMHRLVFSLIEKNSLAGLRIDHIDGLADPATYCRKLREKIGYKSYLIVEKILASYESLPESWRIDGTSGYDALNQINAVFVDPKNQKLMERIYRRFTGISQAFDAILYDAKRMILETSLASEFVSLSLLLKKIAGDNYYSRDFTLDTIRHALKEIVAYFPVYRSYVTDNASAKDKQYIDWAIGKARKYSQLPDRSIYDFISGKLLGANERDYESQIFIQKFQQLSGPAMAKGLEDTSFYRYHCILSLNEVGGDPTRFGLTAKTFHQLMKERQEKWPHSMLTTATHDTKRGEDARARINVLSEIPHKWGRAVFQWGKINKAAKSEIDGVTIPSPNEEYFLYQTLLGSWPNECLDAIEEKSFQAYIPRLKDYITKALREAKINSSWTNPNEAYEASVHQFIDKLLDNKKPNKFLESFIPFIQQIAYYGMVKSLSQQVMKLTLPGVPDIYQGTEFWDYSFVDPDNRRQVDYENRVKTLENTLSIQTLFAEWHDGRVKQRVIQQLLKHRKQYPDLYAYGSYAPSTLKGAGKNHFIAYTREYKSKRLVIIISVFVAYPDPKNCYISIKKGKYKNIFSDQVLDVEHTPIQIDTLLQGLPFAVLESPSLMGK